MSYLSDSLVMEYELYSLQHSGHNVMQYLCG